MSARLAGKTALVTAAAQGIGLATARALAREGARVWGVDINSDSLQTLAVSSQARMLKLDVTSADNVDEAVAQTGPIDILVNAVGWAHHGNILDCTETDWSRTFNLNVHSMYLMIRAYLPGMLKKGAGSIINIASVVSSISGVPNRCAYAASKGAVIGLTKSVAADYLAHGVRCNVICPGTVDTPSLRERLSALPNPKAAEDQFVARQPIGRFGKAEEVAELCVYLASDESAFMIGSELIIDGGMTL